MDITLAKFVAMLVMCEITNYAAGIPILDTPYGHVNARDRRSTSDNFSLFGFGIKTPFAVSNPVRETYNSFKNLFRPASDLFHDENSVRKQTLNTPQRNNEINKNISTVSKPHNGDVTKNGEPALSTSMNNKKPDTVPENNNVNKSNYVLENDKGSLNVTKLVPKIPKADVSNDNEKMPTSTEITTKLFTVENIEKDSEAEIDQKLLDYIFNTNTLHDTTIDTETSDYTTESGDYNSTTVDDLLRIPAPIVASLLG